MKVVTVTTQFVVTPVASVSLPFGSDVHYFVFTVWIQTIVSQLGRITIGALLVVKQRMRKHTLPSGLDGTKVMPIGGTIPRKS